MGLILNLAAILSCLVHRLFWQWLLNRTVALELDSQSQYQLPRAAVKLAAPVFTYAS